MNEQSRLGGHRFAAKRLGISVEEYRRHIQEGQSWCSWHRDWHRVKQFSTVRATQRPFAYCRTGQRERETMLRERDREAFNAYHREYQRRKRATAQARVTETAS